MTTTTLNKTQGTSVLSLQSVAGGAALLSSAIDVSTKVGPATMFVHFGRRATTVVPTTTTYNWRERPRRRLYR